MSFASNRQWSSSLRFKCDLMCTLNFGGCGRSLLYISSSGYSSRFFCNAPKTSSGRTLTPRLQRHERMFNPQWPDHRTRGYLFASSPGCSPFFPRFGSLYKSSGRTSGGFMGTVMYFERISSSGRLGTVHEWSSSVRKCDLPRKLIEKLRSILCCIGRKLSRFW